MERRRTYLVCFLVILAAEVCIALFFRDRFIRPYGGDVLVTVLLCCLGRVFWPKLRWLPGYVLLFAALVEAGQAFDFVGWIGLGDVRFFRILLGSTFSWGDLVCYGVGCALFAVGERLARKRE